MDASRNEAPKLSELVMCGDHPSFTKTELNVKESNSDRKERDKLPIAFPRLSSATSALSRSQLEASRPSSAAASVEQRAVEKRAPLPVSQTTATHTPRQFVQAAIGSFRWPPYLLCVWVCVLALTHALHALVTLLERALPITKKSCQYFRSWTEASWRSDMEPNLRIYRVVLALCTGLLYVLYVTLYATHAVALWLVEPLHNELDVTPSGVEVDQVKVTNYNIEEVKSQ